MMLVNSKIYTRRGILGVNCFGRKELLHIDRVTLENRCSTRSLNAFDLTGLKAFYSYEKIQQKDVHVVIKKSTGWETGIRIDTKMNEYSKYNDWGQVKITKDIIKGYMIVAGAKNRPAMLEKTMYNSWQSRMLLYLKGNKNGRMMLDSIENGPLDYPTIEENGAIRPKIYAKLSEQEKLQDDCDVQVLNIILQDQERECKLYNEFDKFTSIKGELLHEYYLHFAQIINDIHTIGMTMQQVQVNIKFLNALQPKWSKFAIDVKLAKNMYTTNFDKLFTYLNQHEGHANEVRMMRERYPDPLALPQINHPTPSVPQKEYHFPPISQQPPEKFPQIKSGLAVIVFLPGDDPIACLNKSMATVVTSRFPSTNNQLRTSFNPRNQATIQMAGSLFNKLKEDRVKVLMTDDLDTYDSDYDDISSTKAVLMANLRNALKQEINSLKQTLSKLVKEQKSLMQTFTVFKNESKEKERKNIDKEIELENTIKELDKIVYKTGSKDRPPMLAPGNYIQWKSRIKRYIDTKPNRELIHFCLTNPPYELGWKDKPILDAEGNPTTVTQQRFVTLVKQSQELKHVSYHKLYDILKQHQHEVNEIRAEKIARVANPLALVAQQQQVYHP
nr:retrovirus-related Pol polyprotein from transposon TNT 1-94 [Tanacetum cinerariifolium]